jgi:hypothetical protein
MIETYSQNEFELWGYVPLKKVLKYELLYYGKI